VQERRGALFVPNLETGGQNKALDDTFAESCDGSPCIHASKKLGVNRSGAVLGGDCEVCGLLLRCATRPV